MQHCGTHKTTCALSPIMILWLLSIASIGVYNILVWNRSVLWALSPNYIYKFFHYTGKDGLLSLAGIMLCVTGSDAMFAYHGRFTAASIRMAFLCAAYPCLVLQYLGQAAFLSKNFQAFPTSFHASIPDPVFWPVYVLAILVAIIASQSVISGSCSIIKQSHAFGCFPRAKVLHTSRWTEGQLYIPELNWILMVLCLAITVGFRNINHIANAYGIAWITMTMVMTLLIALVIKLVWHKSLVLVVLFFVSYGLIETIFLISSWHGIPRGGWASLLISITFTFVMFVWHYATRKKFLYGQHNKVPMKWILSLGPNLGVIRVPGISLFFTELATGIPSSFTHFLDNLPVFYQVAVFFCVKTVPSYRLYRCIIRNGYKDVNRKEDDFENDLILCLAEFVQLEAEGSRSVDRSTDGRMAVVGPTEKLGTRVETLDTSLVLGGGMKSAILHKLQARYMKESSELIHRRSVQFKVHGTMFKDPGVKEELLELVEAKGSGVTYIIGHSHVKAKSHSSFLKKFVINVAYSFLRKNSRSPSVVFNIPQVCLIEVGMNYHV
ncbi:hypothetical protein CRG98_022718 [Punica granatum]|uniref:Potassium transporter n=1 Tax=Punica granatum TaxID=22663 RepID=A0A2I0JKT9_PUNGR|nr:hypothetical protein CRG98_022718 [Punica granatum]